MNGETLIGDSRQNGSAFGANNLLLAREVSQVLIEAIIGRSRMIKVKEKSWKALYTGHFMVDVEGWRL